MPNNINVLAQFPTLKRARGVLCPGMLFLFITIYLPAMAQEIPTFKGPVVYLEGGGQGGDYSVNGEHIFAHWGGMKFNAHAGFGMATFNAVNGGKRNFMSFPIGVNLVTGNGFSHIEVGAGLAYIRGNDALFGINSKSLFFIPGFGIRFQGSQGGFFAKLLYTPYFKLNEYSDVEAFQSKQMKQGYGISLGYFFAR